MKKLFIVWIALFFALSSAGLASAQEKVKKEEPAGITQSATQKSTEAVKAGEAQGKEQVAGNKEVPVKPQIWRMGGLVTAVDPQNKTITVHQETVFHDRVLKLRANGNMAKDLMPLKPGDLINVWVNGKVIEALKKVA
jgi:hypothetical protein